MRLALGLVVMSMEPCQRGSAEWKTSIGEATLVLRVSVVSDPT